MFIHNASYFQPRPTTQHFALDVLSHHPDHDNKILRKYNVEGIDTIGVFGDEAFSIRFTNNSAEDVQIRVSLDGVDCMTGKLADLSINSDMWVVRARNSLTLKAWHESQAGGSRFVFTNGDKSVALYATGDVSHRGIIAVAVYTSADRAKWVYGTPTFNAIPTSFDPYKTRKSMTMSSSTRIGSSGGTFSTTSMDSLSTEATSAGVDYSSVRGVPCGEIFSDITDAIDPTLKREASVGAGEFVPQPTKTVKGINNPELNSIVRVRYQWWTELQEEIDMHNTQPCVIDKWPTGFAAEKRTFADLSMVPKTDSASIKATLSRFV